MKKQDLKGERVLWINDKTVGGGAGKLYRTAAEVLAVEGAVIAPFFGLHLPGEVDQEYLPFQPKPLGEKDYPAFLQRSLGDSGLIKQLERLRLFFRPTVVVVQNCHKYIGPDVIPVVKGWGVPLILLVNDYGIYCVNCYGWRAGSVCHACADKRFARALWRGCALRPGFVSKAMSATRTVSLALAWRKDAYFQADAVLTAGGRFRSRLIDAGFSADRVKAGIFPHHVSGAPLDYHFEPPSVIPSFIYYGSDLMVKGQGLLFDALRYVRHRCRLLLYVLKPSDLLRQRAAEVALINPLVEVMLDAEAKWETGVREAVLAARAVIAPSVWESPHELVVYESLAMGRPVIVTDCSSNSELITDGEEGFVVPADAPQFLASRIDTLGLDPALAEKMGRRGRVLYNAKLRPEFWAQTFFETLADARGHSRS